MTSDKLNQAVKFIKAGDKQAAIAILKEIIQTEPNNEMAWLWLYSCVNKVEQKKYCIQQALRINPNNQNAHATLLKLEDQVIALSGSVNAQSFAPSVQLQTQQIGYKNRALNKAKMSSRQRAFLFLEVVLLLLVSISGVIFVVNWIYDNSIYKNQFVPTMKEQIVYTASPTQIIQPSSTPIPSLVYLSILKPSFTPYPTNTLFVLPTWTSTESPPTQTPTPNPTQVPAQNSTAVERTPVVNENKSNSTQIVVPTKRISPSKTPKPDITISCDVNPKIIQVGTNTTLTVFAQIYIDGSASTTVAIVAEWEDGLGHKMHCTSSGDSCEGQSGYLTAHAKSTINVGASSADGSRRNCQTTFRTN